MKIFCQYNFGGFQNFEIHDENDERLVAIDNSLPIQLRPYFATSHVVLALLEVSGGIALIIRELKSNELDTSGNAMDCDLAIVSGKEQLTDLLNICNYVSLNHQEFERKVASVFSIEKDGLHAKGNILYQYLSECSSYKENIPWAQLRNTYSFNLFLVVKSSKFGSDETITDNIIKDLNLPAFNVVKGHYISKESFYGRSDYNPHNELKSVEPIHISVADYLSSKKKIIGGIVAVAAVAGLASLCNDKTEKKNESLNQDVEDSTNVIHLRDSIQSSDLDSISRIECEDSLKISPQDSLYHSETDSLPKGECKDSMSFPGDTTQVQLLNKK